MIWSSHVSPWAESREEREEGRSGGKQDVASTKMTSRAVPEKAGGGKAFFCGGKIGKGSQEEESRCPVPVEG